MAVIKAKFGSIILLLILCISCQSQNGIKYYNEGVKLMEWGKYSQALEKFNQGIAENDEGKAANYYGKAYSSYELGRIDQAYEAASKSLETETINSKSLNSQIYWIVGLISGEQENPANEISSYEKAIKYSPEDNFLKTSYALTLIEQKREKEGIEVLNKILAEQGNDPFALNNRALDLIQGVFPNFNKHESNVQIILMAIIGKIVKRICEKYKKSSWFMEFEKEFEIELFLDGEPELQYHVEILT